MEARAAHARGVVGAVGIAAADRQPPHHRHARLREHPCAGQRRRLRAGFEPAAHADALAVRTAEAGMRRAGGFDGVGEALRGQAVADPAGQPGEGQGDGTQDERDQGDPEQRRMPARCAWRLAGAGIAEERHGRVPAFTERVGGRPAHPRRTLPGPVFKFSSSLPGTAWAPN
ncbi:hypothetical protein G6F68_012910 [Rhizopus microsporus]|nr:hypothetical protein G6F68_012910 [Rhizopus microsporus]